MKSTQKCARISRRGFVAQWLERATSIRKTLVRIPAELPCVFFFLSSDPASRSSIFVREKGEKFDFLQLRGDESVGKHSCHLHSCLAAVPCFRDVHLTSLPVVVPFSFPDSQPRPHLVWWSPVYSLPSLTRRRFVVSHQLRNFAKNPMLPPLQVQPAPSASVITSNCRHHTQLSFSHLQFISLHARLMNFPNTCKA